MLKLFVTLHQGGTLPCIFKVNKPGIQADRIVCLCKLLAHSPFGSLHPFTVRKIGDFPHFLSALASNNQFIIKLVKMWPGGTPHVVVGTLKISFDRLKKKKIPRRSLVECCSVSSCE